MSDAAPEAPWWLAPGFIAFDTETTGTNPDEGRIVTAAAVLFEGGEVVDEQSWLLRIDIPIPPESTAVHGITNDHSQMAGIDQAEGLVSIRDYLVDSALPVVAFNSAFDFAMLETNLQRIGASTSLGLDVLCPYVIDKQCNKYVRGSGQRKLQPTAARYDIELTDDQWHDATGDAIAAGRTFLAEMAAYAQLRTMTASELASSVDTWRTQQDEEFKAWLASKQS